MYAYLFMQVCIYGWVDGSTDGCVILCRYAFRKTMHAYASAYRGKIVYHQVHLETVLYGHVIDTPLIDEIVLSLERQSHESYKTRQSIVNLKKMQLRISRYGSTK